MHARTPSRCACASATPYSWQGPSAQKLAPATPYRPQSLSPKKLRGNCRMVGRGGPRVSVSFERGFFAPLGLAILGSNDARFSAGMGIPPKELLVARRDRRTGCATANDQGTGIHSDKLKRTARDGKRPGRAERRRGCAYERTSRIRPRARLCYPQFPCKSEWAGQGSNLRPWD